jgi:hypothetical protein
MLHNAGTGFLRGAGAGRQAFLKAMTKKSKRNRTQVFVSYAREDRFWLERLQKHLLPIEQERISDRSDFHIDVWSDLEIRPGGAWERDLQAALASARVGILLVSVYLLDSTYINQRELPDLLKAQADEGVTILPIFVGDIGRKTADIGRLLAIQGVNNPERPLAGLDWPDQELVFARAANRVREIFGLPTVPVRVLPPGGEWARATEWSESGLPTDREARLQVIREREYLKLWRMTQVLPKWPKASDVTCERLLQFSKDLQNWYFAGGGMYLSRQAQGTYKALQEVLAGRVRPHIERGRLARTTERDRTRAARPVTDADYEAIRAKCSSLRTQLTKDLESRRRGGQ